MEPETTIKPRSRKWFWLGILFCFIAPPVPGLIYGIALATEKEQRRDGIIIIACALVWFTVVYTTVTYFASRHLATSLQSVMSQLQVK